MMRLLHRRNAWRRMLSTEVSTNTSPLQETPVVAASNKQSPNPLVVGACFLGAVAFLGISVLKFEQWKVIVFKKTGEALTLQDAWDRKAEFAKFYVFKL